MRHSSAVKDYETAAETRNQINFINQLFSEPTLSETEDEIMASSSPDLALFELQKLLHLASKPKRIEGYDIANLQGHDATGSMVVATDGIIDKSAYRQFGIKLPPRPNDTAMITEVIHRRVNHPEWGKPDVIMVDGGKPQVNAAQKVLQNLPNTSIRSFRHIPIIGLAKKEETLIISGQEIHLNRRHPALKLIQTLRDEAHRFAQSYHHRLHDRHLLKS